MCLVKRRQKKQRNVSPTIRRLPGYIISMAHSDYLSRLSLEILCHILKYLSLREVLCMEQQCHKLHEAVFMHLRVIKKLNFTEGNTFDYMSRYITDDAFSKLLHRCPDVEYIYGLHPNFIAKRRQRGSEILSIPGVVAALTGCNHLSGIETSHLCLLEAILVYLPHVNIVGKFRNRNGEFPIPVENKLILPTNPKIAVLELIGVILPELPEMGHLQQLYLQWVRFTKPQPFRNFVAINLQSFVMQNCAGPTNALKYVALMAALATAHSLSRVEFIRVPFLGGLIQHVVEDSWRMQGFQHLRKITFASCKHVLETDLGYLILTCGQQLEELNIQPSLTKDSVFSALHMANADFPKFKRLYLGFIDDFPEPGKWTNEKLVAQGLADIVESPALITDLGMKAVGQTFPSMKYLSVYNCPHLHHPSSWLVEGVSAWSNLKDLTLRRCHAIKLEDFYQFLKNLPVLESIHLEHMFREPPKGCARVGLSAGTGLGVSSALVSNQNDGAVVGNVVPPPPQDPHPPSPPPLPQAPPPPPPSPPLPFVPPPVLRHDRLISIEDDDSEAERVLVAESLLEISKCRTNVATNEVLTNVEEMDVEKPGPSGLNKMSTLASPHDAMDIDSDDSLKESKSSRQSYKGKGKGIGKKSKQSDCEPFFSSERVVNQSCQATCEEIRETTKQARENAENHINANQERHVSRSGKSDVIHTAVNKTTSPKIGRKNKVQDKAVQTPLRKPNTCDKATSTSDPVLEEDPVQVLTVKSSSLVSLSLFVCGISDIVIKECPKLQHIGAVSCRVLKQVFLEECPKIYRMNLVQCPKLNSQLVIGQMCKLPSERSRMLFLRPMEMYDPIGVEELMFSNPNHKYHMYLIQDHTGNLKKTVSYRLRVLDWLDLITRINQELLLKYAFLNAFNQQTTVKFPWGRDIYWIHGSVDDGHFEITTDVPWLRILWNASIQKNYSDNLKFENGLYNPSLKGHRTVDECIQLLQEEIYERVINGFNNIYQHSLAVYIHASDIYNTPMEDLYS